MQLVQFTMFCIAGVITQIAGYHFSSLTVTVISIIDVQRWLHMSRRSPFSVRRFVVPYIYHVCSLLIAFVACYMYSFYYANEISFTVISVLGAPFCFGATVFAYYKVYRIIRHHKNQVQTNEK